MWRNFPGFRYLKDWPSRMLVVIYIYIFRFTSYFVYRYYYYAAPFCFMEVLSSPSCFVAVLYNHGVVFCQCVFVSLDSRFPVTRSNQPQSDGTTILGFAPSLLKMWPPSANLSPTSKQTWSDRAHPDFTTCFRQKDTIIPKQVANATLCVVNQRFLQCEMTRAYVCNVAQWVSQLFCQCSGFPLGKRICHNGFFCCVQPGGGNNPPKNETCILCFFYMQHWSNQTKSTQILVPKTICQIAKPNFKVGACNLEIGHMLTWSRSRSQQFAATLDARHCNWLNSFCYSRVTRVVTKCEHAIGCS